MEAEAALQPPSVRLNTNTRKYTIQQLKLAPSHPINWEFSNMPRRPNPKATVQLERIRASIQDLVNQEDLESLQHFTSLPGTKIRYIASISARSPRTKLPWYTILTSI